jgi:NAD(P)H dehydrogenase (quinone)
MSRPVVAIAFDSPTGHTRAVAEAVARGAGRMSAAELVDVADLTADRWECLRSADAIVFGSPVHLGGPTSRFVAFAEATARLAADAAWRDKPAAGFATSAAMAGGKAGVLRAMSDLASQHGMVWVNLDLRAGWNSAAGSPHDLNRLGYRLGLGVQCDTDASPAGIIGSDLATAEHLGHRVARFAGLLLVPPVKL